MSEFLYAIDGDDDPLQHDNEADVLVDWFDGMATDVEVQQAIAGGVTIVKYRADKPDPDSITANLAASLWDQTVDEVVGDECMEPNDDVIATLRTAVRAYFDQVGAVVPVKMETNTWTSEALQAWAKDNGYA